MIKFDIPAVETTQLKYGVSMINIPVFKKDIPVMALSVVKKKYNEGAPFRGVVREIVKRSGDPSVMGFVDQSKLFMVESTNLIGWRETGDLNIKGIEHIINSIKRQDFVFIGLEDPDIFIDEKHMYHLFFTIAFKVESEQLFAVFLGHAQGDGLETLAATEPVLSPEISANYIGLGYKEASLIPGTDSISLAMAETGCGTLNTSIVAAKISEPGKPWKFTKRVLDPLDQKYEWMRGELSPGPVFDPDFIQFEGNMVGLFNARSPAKEVSDKIIHGEYTVGVMLINPKTGEIPWVSPEPFIKDPQAKSITFTSDFVQTAGDRGILYAHIDDSFVRGYMLTNEVLFKYIKDLQR